MTTEFSTAPRNARVDYLVGGFRISLGTSSNTPGPRSHIEGFTGALKTAGHRTTLYLASDFPAMSRFAGIREGGYKGSGDLKVWLADLVRVGASLWSGLNVFVKTAARPQPDVIYERVAVFQSLSSFHARKKGAYRVAEANGVLSRETARDRQALKAEWYARWLEKRVLRRADLVVAVSANLRDELIKFAGIASDKILVVPNGIDTAVCRIPRRQSARRTVGFVGAIVEWQHLERLIDAISEINKTQSSTQQVDLEIIGDGPELEGLRKHAAALNTEKQVHFYGRLSHAEAVDRMAGWDVGFAGHEKSSSGSMYHSPLKVYEYAALGVSIVCTPSADAEMLQSTGSKVYFVGNDELIVPEAIRQALHERRTMHATEIEHMRRSVATAHSWEERMNSVLITVGKKAAGRVSVQGVETHA